LINKTSYSADIEVSELVTISSGGVDYFVTTIHDVATRKDYLAFVSEFSNITKTIIPVTGTRL